MSKTEKAARPRKGGSYVRDADTGKLDRVEYTKPALSRREREAREKAKNAGPTRDELIAIAEAEGIDISGARNNAERLAAIEAARAAKSGSDEQKEA